MPNRPLPSASAVRPHLPIITTMEQSMRGRVQISEIVLQQKNELVEKKGTEGDLTSEGSCTSPVLLGLAVVKLGMKLVLPLDHAGDGETTPEIKTPRLRLRAAGRGERQWRFARCVARSREDRKEKIRSRPRRYHLRLHRAACRGSAEL